jgi:hypothetical protein
MPGITPRSSVVPRRVGRARRPGIGFVVWPLGSGARVAALRVAPREPEAYAGADSGASSWASPARPPTNSAATTNPISATTAT